MLAKNVNLFLSLVYFKKMCLNPMLNGGQSQSLPMLLSIPIYKSFRMKQWNFVILNTNFKIISFFPGLKIFLNALNFIVLLLSSCALCMTFVLNIFHCPHFLIINKSLL